MGDGRRRRGEGPRRGDIFLLLLLPLLLVGGQGERFILLFDIVGLGVRAAVMLRGRNSTTKTQVLAPLG